MTKKQIDNTLYNFVIMIISNILPLEYAIRATETSYPKVLSHLRKTDEEIRNYLTRLGAKPQEICGERLAEYAWDTLQFGRSCVRNHGVVFKPEISEIIKRCKDEIRSIIRIDADDLALPAAKYFRICDLLNGNDIGQLLRVTTECLSEARDYKKHDDLDIRRFRPALRIATQPVHLHPGSKVEASIDKNQILSLTLSIDLLAELSEFEIRRQVEEFLYQFSLARLDQMSPRVDNLSSTLINRFLQKVYSGELSEYQVTRLDGAAAVLAGLYCRDLVKRSKKTIAVATEETQKEYSCGEDAVLKNYRQANDRVKKYVARFRGS